VVSTDPTSLRPESDHRIYTCTEPHEYVAAVGIINCASFSPLSLSLFLSYFSLAAFLHDAKIQRANAESLRDERS